MATSLVHFDTERSRGTIPAPLTWFPPRDPLAIAQRIYGSPSRVSSPDRPRRCEHDHCSELQCRRHQTRGSVFIGTRTAPKYPAATGFGDTPRPDDVSSYRRLKGVFGDGCWRSFLR